MKNALKLIMALALCQFVGLASTPFTMASISTWYVTLEKPFFSPPNWLFAPVWTLLYLSMGFAFFLIWRQGWRKKASRIAGSYFFAQLALNFLWSIFFFGLRSPLLGLLDILVLLALILLTIQKFLPLSRTAGRLLVPYAIWVAFATLLNLAIVILN